MSCPGPAPSLQYGTSPGPLQCWGGEDGDVHPSRPGHSADEEGGDSECVQQPAEYEKPENEDGADTSECLREQVGKERGPIKPNANCIKHSNIFLH